MNKKLIVTILLAAITVAMLAMPICAKGPAKANMGQKGNGNWEYCEESDGSYNSMADMYVGADYGVGSTPTITIDGIYIDIIEYATLMDKGHYFSEWYEPISDKDWVAYKFWLTEPVNIIFPGDVLYTATQFLFIKVHFSSDGTHTIMLQAYR